MKANEKIKVALRVLTACSSGVRPEERDIATLQGAGVADLDLPLEDLARTLVQTWLRTPRV